MFATDLPVAAAMAEIQFQMNLAAMALGTLRQVLRFLPGGDWKEPANV